MTGYFITPKATSHRPYRLLGLSGMHTGGSVTTQNREIYGDKVPRPRYPQGLGCCLSPQDQMTNLHFHHPFAQGGTPQLGPLQFSQQTLLHACWVQGGAGTGELLISVTP